MPLEMQRERVVITNRERDRWPVDWSAIWVGVLTAIAVALLFGLAATAVGAHQAASRGIVKWSDFGFGALVFSVVGAFAAFAAGGWVAGKIAAFRRSEPSMLHGAIVWLVAVPILLIGAALGAGGVFGAWYSGLAGTPIWVTPAATPDPNAAIAARNAALGSITGLLIGLIGGVVGGWMASGEPMTFTHYRMRDRVHEHEAGEETRRIA